MIAVEEIRKQAERAYPRFLSSLVTGEPFFPLEVRFGKQFMKGTYHEFEEQRRLLFDGAARLVDQPETTGDGAAFCSSASRRSAGYVIELERHNSRRFGPQEVPARIYFDAPAEYAAFLGRRKEAEAFRTVLEATRSRVPDLLPWLGRSPTRTLPYVDVWTDLLEVVRYFVEHPRPNLSARQLPLSVHTKFVEQHQGMLRMLLEEVLPEEVVDRAATDFGPRFGLRYDEPIVRMRRLDPLLEPDWPGDDVSLPVSTVAELTPNVDTILISENKMTFLTLPRIDGGLAIWGGGFRVEVLRDVAWLRQRSVYYWGDLDAHGFMILSALRSFVPAARSLMMDVETFDAFRRFAVNGSSSEVETLPHLTPAEQAVFQSLGRTRLRLEQERISQAYVEARIAELG